MGYIDFREKNKITQQKVAKTAESLCLCGLQGDGGRGSTEILRREIPIHTLGLKKKRNSKVLA